MKRINSILVASIALLGLASSANAGYWEVVYDLTGSTVLTSAGGLTDIDQVTGSWTIQYDTPGPAGSPITGARLTAGATTLLMNQPNAGLFLLTGTTTTTYTIGGSGIVGTIAGATLSGLSGIANTVTGSLHCYDGSFMCSQVTAFTHSTPTPQISTGPVNLGNLVFGGGSGSPGVSTTFTTTGSTITLPSPPNPVTVFLTSTYVGKELSRKFVGSVTSLPAMSNAGRYGLGLLMLLAGASTLALRHSLRKRPTA